MLTWGVVGASTIAAEYMIHACRSLKNGRVEAVLSSSFERGQNYANQHAIPKAYVDLDQMLDDPTLDAVYISTTNEKHKDQALAAIGAGKHVLCEKPLALSVCDAALMVRAAREAGVVLATNHHLRNAGSHLAIKALLDEGAIGDVHAVRVFHAVYLPPHLQGWRINNPSAGGGVISDIVVHDADTVRFHLGEDPIDVTAVEASLSLGQGVEDSVMGVWRMPSGAIVQTHEGFTLKYAQTGIEFHGERGSIVARNVMTPNPIGEIVLRNEQGETTVAFSKHNLYERSVSQFCLAVLGQGSPAADGVDGVKSLAIAQAVKQAALSGVRTVVDYGEF